jgi:importin-5
VSPSTALHSKQAANPVLFRRHPMVMGQAPKIFVFIAQALEAETLQGQTASRVAAATKMLLASSNVDPTPLLQQFPKESQTTIMKWFA